MRIDKHVICVGQKLADQLDGCMQMLDRLAEQRQDAESSSQEARRQLQAQEEELAIWKAETQRQLDVQQVCLPGSCLFIHAQHT